MGCWVASILEGRSPHGCARSGCAERFDIGASLQRTPAQREAEGQFLQRFRATSGQPDRLGRIEMCTSISPLAWLIPFPVFSCRSMQQVVLSSPASMLSAARGGHPPPSAPRAGNASRRYFVAVTPFKQGSDRRSAHVGGSPAWSCVPFMRDGSGVSRIITASRSGRTPFT